MAKQSIPKLKRTCQVEGCERSFYAKGYCSRHYSQMKIHGKTFGNPKRRKIATPNRHRFEDGVCKIELCDCDGYHQVDAVVNMADYKKIKGIKWCLCNGYVQTYDGLKLHRFLLGLTPNDDMVDHKNMNPLDNRRCNLRICSKAKNLQNRGKPINNKSGYKGVHWDKSRNKWKSAIQANKKQYNLGRFKSKTDAALAYDKAAKKHHGEFARLNFPEGETK